MLVPRLLTAISFVLVVLTILIGGIVHATGSSLGCPDWPLCFGQWFPAMQGAVLYEHSHRIVAGLSGIMVWVTGIWGAFDQRVTTVQKRLLYVSMGLILVQATLGGITVLWQMPTWVSTTHFILAQTTLVLLMIVLWSMEKVTQPTPDHHTANDSARRVAILMFTVVVVQMILGALTRHMGSTAPLVSPDQTTIGTMLVPCERFPVCDPKWIEWMTPGYLWIYWIHRIGAVFVTAIMGFGVWTFWRTRGEGRRCFNLSLLAMVTVFVQMILGVVTVRSYLEPVSVTLHYAGAIILLMTVLMVLLEAYVPGNLVTNGD